MITNRFLKVCKIFKWLIISIIILSVGFIYIFIKLADTFDGREYTASDYVHYYFETPELFKDPPDIPGRITYYSQGDDNYGFTQNDITWNDIEDVPAAQKIIEQFFISKGYTQRENGLVWRFYWSDIAVIPETCAYEQYSTVWGYHAISIELITATRGCQN